MTRISPVFCVLLALLAGGCVSIDYKGKSFARTNKVAVYTKKAELPANYSVMGRAVVTAPYKFSREEMQEKLLDRAKSEGADGVHITGYMIVPEDSARLDQAMETSASVRYDRVESNTQASVTSMEQNFNHGYGQAFASPQPKDTSTYKRVLKAQFIKLGGGETGGRKTKNASLEECAKSLGEDAPKAAGAKK